MGVQFYLFFHCHGSSTAGDSKDILAGGFYIAKVEWIFAGCNSTLVVALQKHAFLNKTPMTENTTPRKKDDTLLKAAGNKP